jgi:primosomal protein N' (replication factor Y)
LFLPYKKLGAIVVDEEHDQSYKQEASVIYHARDLAVMRGHAESCVVVLSSATPSLETLHNCQHGKYAHLLLPKRHGESLLPSVELLDMRRTKKEKSRQWIAPQLQEALKTAFDCQEQALLFLNRRGYAPLLVCHSCGHHMNCPNCTTWLVYHKAKHMLQCHHCNYIRPFPSNCPSCHEVDVFLPCGPGVERLAEEVEQLFPEAKVLVMTSDTLSSPKKAEDLMTYIQERKIDCIIGTQIMAKGHHFPFLTLVGIVDADIGLGGGDLRAAEKTYQLLYQVSGRAGRSSLPGRVLVQTYTPEHPVMQAIQHYDHDSFLSLEMLNRCELTLPPFGKLASLIIAGKDSVLTEQFVRHMGSKAPQHEKVEILGPAPAMLHKVHNWYRWRFLVKTPRDISSQKVIRKWLEGLSIPSSVKVMIDIDPYSFL